MCPFNYPAIVTLMISESVHHTLPDQRNVFHRHAGTRLAKGIYGQSNQRFPSHFTHGSGLQVSQNSARSEPISVCRRYANTLLRVFTERKKIVAFTRRRAIFMAGGISCRNNQNSACPSLRAFPRHRASRVGELSYRCIGSFPLMYPYSGC